MLPNDKEIVLQVSVPEVSAGLLEDARQVGIRRLLTKDQLPSSISTDGFSLLTVSDQPGDDRVSWVRVAGA